uniref:NADH-ubiquinone oxidoreductase chain 2 n=1 Tax=Liposcelis sculptilimacula TaxID=1899352 RepID=A0A191ZS67_9NEOP|nr:NADH dehydrogenase subunit 2 [Liposcelis keleri]ANJ70941.1 NADH dehydrogenase subunit 2 [Liposcelis sculptilimacula]
MFMIVSSPNWILMWVSLEINSMIFLMISNKFSKSFSEFEFKYYLIQFLGSSLYFYSGVMNFSYMLFLSLMIKLIMIPFIYWVITGLKWMEKKIFFSFIFFQKIGPLILIWEMMVFNTMGEMLFLILNFLFSMMSGLKKIFINEILVFSSVNQVVLMVLIMKFSKSLFFIYALIYFFTSLLIFLIYSFMKGSMILIFSFLLISGFPPSLIFFSKISFLIFLMDKLLILIMILSITTSMFFIYMKLFLNHIFKKKKLKLHSVNYSHCLFFIIIFLFMLLG